MTPDRDGENSSGTGRKEKSNPKAGGCCKPGPSRRVNFPWPFPPPGDMENSNVYPRVCPEGSHFQLGLTGL